MWFHNRFFKYLVGTVLVLLIIYLIYSVQFLFWPVIEFIATLFLPIMLAGVLYYIFRPIVRALEMKFSRTGSVGIIFLFIFIGLVLFFAYVAPLVIEQVVSFTNSPEDKLHAFKEKTANFMQVFKINFFSIDEFRHIISNYLYKINEMISSNILDALTSITRFTMLLFMTPFILFYFLKDDRLIFEHFMDLVPVEYSTETRTVLHDMDRILSNFITGQLLVALILGGLLLTGYLLIGLDYAVLLALFATIFVMIPIFGSFIAIIPALLVGLSVSPFMGLKVIMVMLTAQILEGNFISPQIMAHRLHIHPLMIMLILLASGSLYGILGLFLATPVYALLKGLFINIRRIYMQESKN